MIDNILKDTVRDSLDSMIVELDLMPVFPSLVWLWTWDQIQSQYGGDNLTPLFDKFWETAMEEGWTLQYGTEAMSEHVTDWLIKHEFLGEEE